MKITFVDHAGDPGGGQLGLLRYVQSPYRRADVRCILLTGGPIVDQLRDAGAEVVVLDDREFEFRRFPIYAAGLHRNIKRGDGRIVVANSLYAAVAVSLVPRPGLWTYYSRVSMNTLAGVKRVIATQWVFRRAASFLANSNWTASCIPAKLTARPVAVAYPVSGIPSEPNSRHRRGFMEDGSLKIVSLSRPDRWKGIDLVIAAADAVATTIRRPVTVDIYGGTFFSDERYIEELHKMAETSAAVVTFHGHIEDVNPVLQSSDVVALGNRLPEPFGQVVAQGLSAGCLLVVPDAGGPTEMVHDGVNGYVYESGDQQALVRALLSAVTSPDEAADVAARGPVSAAAFGDRQTVSGLETAIDHLTRAEIGT